MEELLYQVIGKLYVQNTLLSDQVGVLEAEVGRLNEAAKPAKRKGKGKGRKPGKKAKP